MHVPLAPRAPRPRACARLTAGLLLGGILLPACSTGTAPASSAERGLRASSQQGEPSPPPSPSSADPGSAAASPAVRPLAERRQADVLVVGRSSLPSAVRERLAALSRGGAVVFRAGTAEVEGHRLPVVGVDPSSFRAFTAAGTAESDAVWAAVARGEAVVAHEAAERTGLELGGAVRVVQAADGPAPRAAAGARAPGPLRLGALATTGLPQADVVVDERTADRLGLPAATAMLLSAGEGQDPEDLATEVREVAGSATVDLLSTPAPVARLTGGEAAQDLGSFSYRYFADGSIEPDAAWVRENIRTESVPIFGEVTCHRLMLPQLRGALQDVVDAGLSSTLKVYSGCYVPRFIARDPDRPISLHTWGIAIDFDAATNYRGIRGTMDARVVEIFKRWGFVWGGDWAYTDPMHFELATIVTEPAG